MKLSSFIKEMSFKDMQHLNKENEETDLYDILKSKRHDINVDFGPRTYSMLQQQMMLGNEGYVRDWMEKNSFIEQQDDWPPKDKALDEQIRKVIKKEIAKLHETDYADRLANSGTDSKGLDTWDNKTGYSDDEMAQGKGELKTYPDKYGRNVWGDKTDYSELETLVVQGEKMAAFADKQSGYEGGIDSPVRNVLTAMKVAGGPGFDGDVDMIDYYTRKLSKAIKNPH
jgi:hypothetical protein